MIAKPFFFASGIAFIALATRWHEWPAPGLWNGFESIFFLVAGTLLVWISIEATKP